MKVGIRKPNVKKMVKARTVGKVKRAVKKSVNPLYGKKGVGYLKNPEKAIKNKIYHDTTVGMSDILKTSNKKGKVTTKKEEKKKADLRKLKNDDIVNLPFDEFSDECMEILEERKLELQAIYNEIRLSLEDGRYNDCVKNVNAYAELSEKYGVIINNGVFNCLLCACEEGGASKDEILSVYDEIIEYYEENFSDGWQKSKFIEDKEYYIKKNN